MMELESSQKLPVIGGFFMGAGTSLPSHPPFTLTTIRGSRGWLAWGRRKAYARVDRQRGAIRNQ
jgi:hypothetical protein